jgi:hypothetical protein
MAFEVSGLLEVQMVLEEVRMQLTISPLTGVYVNVGEFSPAGRELAFL